MDGDQPQRDGSEMWEDAEASVWQNVTYTDGVPDTRVLPDGNFFNGMCSPPQPTPAWESASTEYVCEGDERRLCFVFRTHDPNLRI